jgi:D-3-phosphoglycerate dehydrogenase
LAAREIAMLKPSAIIINTARGGVVDEKALAAALASGKLAAAGVDVYETEPPGPDHPLSKLDQAILTPHMASMTLEGAERMAVSAAQNIIDFFNGKLDADLVVNREAIGFAPGQ